MFCATALWGAWGAVAAAMLHGGQAAFAQCEYTVLHTLPNGPPCGPFNTYTPIIFSIADDGSVCGFAGAGVCGTDRPFLWSPGDATLTLLPFPPGMVAGRAMDLNENGVVVGWCAASTSGNPRPCVWVKGVPTLLPIPTQANGGEALAVNSSGAIVGHWINTGTGPAHAARWDATAFAFTDIHPSADWLSSFANDISDLDIVVGRVSMGTTASIRGFIRTGTAVTILPPISGGITSEVMAVNNAGHVVGIGYLAPALDPGFAQRSFVWRNGAMTDLGSMPPLRDTLVRGINDSGRAVGACSPGVDSRTFLWEGGHLAQVSVNGLLQVATLVCINDHDQVAFGRTILGPVPRPPFDIDQNCVVNVNDLLAVIVDWGMTRSSADCNQDGIVDWEDLLLVVSNWG